MPADSPAAPPAITVSFACVLSETEVIAQQCVSLRPGCTHGPCETPWNTVDVTVTTPKNATVIMTAARPLDPGSDQARRLADAGLDVPGR